MKHEFELTPDENGDYAVEFSSVDECLEAVKSGWLPSGTPVRFNPPVDHPLGHKNKVTHGMVMDTKYSDTEPTVHRLCISKGESFPHDTIVSTADVSTGSAKL